MVIIPEICITQVSGIICTFAADMKKIVLSVIMLAMTASTAKAQNVQSKAAENSTLQLVSEWDKTFPKSDKVRHEKVTFRNRFGIMLAADLYVPKEAKGGLAAIAVSGPFGAVKEQASGLYAQRLAEEGFLTIAFDPSFTGESGGEPRYSSSMDINTEDFCAAVDYLSCRDDVDAGRIGILGICGWRGQLYPMERDCQFLQNKLLVQRLAQGQSQHPLCPVFHRQQPSCTHCSQKSFG